MKIDAAKAYAILTAPPGRDRDRMWSYWLRTLGDDDLIYLVSLAATMLAARNRTSEGSMMRQLTELVVLQDAAQRDAARQAATS